MNRLIIIVPAYNEEESLLKSIRILDSVLKGLIQGQRISDESKIVVVNDGSTDSTWEIIREESKINNSISGINLSRNFGHQNAIIAGLTTLKNFGDIFITIDADLQDDVAAIEKMIDAYDAGFDVVYGARSSRDTDTKFKRWTAEIFYTMMNKIGVEMVPDSADYRLTSRRVVDHLLEFKEHSLFLRGIIPKIGFSSTVVYYARKERDAGQSKYPINKMLSFAWDGITSFSVAPIRLVLSISIIITVVSLFMMLYTGFRYFSGQTIQGWSSLMISIWFLGGIQLFGLAIIGEYVGKVFNETKARPRFIVQTNLLADDSHADK